MSNATVSLTRPDLTSDLGFPPQSSQLFSTVSRTRLVYSFRLSLYKLEASTLAGEPVLGSLSRLQGARVSYFVRFPAYSRAYLCLFHLPLDARKHRGNIVGWAPPILEDVQTQLAGGVDVGVKHGADELDRWWLVGILLLEVHHEPECAIFEGGIGGADDNGVPARGDVVLAIRQEIASWEHWGRPYHVMTLSGTGDAETPAGGSVCMRC